MTLYISSLLTILLISALAAWLINESQKRLEAANNGIIEKLDSDNLDLRNRMYATKGQPPAGVDMKSAYTQEQAEKKDKQNSSPKRIPIDPIQQMEDRLDPPPKEIIPR